MSDGFNKLKELGAQKIHEDTHITKEHVQAVLHNSFEGMNKIQFLGFIAILERDYNVNLNDLKIKGLEYFLNIELESAESGNIFIEENKKSYTIYIVVILLVVAVVAFFILNKTFFNETQELIEKVDDTAIENVQSNFLQNTNTIVEINSSNTENNSLVIDKQKLQITEDITNIKINNIVKKSVDTEEKVLEPKSFLKVMPNTKLWIGYTDLKKNKTYQKLFIEELSLDPNKDWLLNLGHGNVSFEVNGKTIDYKSIKNMKFLYKDGNLTEITYKQFANIKKDNKW